MPKVNVYLPDELAEAVKEAGLPVSPICQHALEQAVRRVAALRAGLRLEIDVAEPAARLTGFTERARTAVTLAAERARERQAERVGTADVLAGILDEGANLALRVLRSLELDLDIVRDGLAAVRTEEAAAGEEAFRLAVNEAITLGHNYVGCEHLLLGLVAEPNGTAGTVLRSLGAEPRLVRRAVAAALGGFVHARGQDRTTTVDELRAILDPLVARLSRLEERVSELAERS